MRLLTLVLVASALAASVDFKQIDALYRHRDAPGNLDKSIALLKAQSPRDAEVEWRLGRALIADAGRKSNKEEKLAVLADAKLHLEQAVALSPADAQAHYWLARQMGAENEIRRTLGLAKSMKKELEQSIRLDGGNAAAHQTYGELLRQLPGIFGGDKKKAVSELELAVGLRPDDPGRWVALAQAYLAVDNKPAARAALKRALAVAKPEDPGSAADDRKDAQKLLDSLK